VMQSIIHHICFLKITHQSTSVIQVDMINYQWWN
jgi:hypothetical protein